MSTASFYALIGVGLFVIGFYWLLLSSDDLRRILSINVMGSGVFMVLIAAAGVAGSAVDPVPHAMVLTGIVVAVSATAFALALSLARERAK